MTLCLACVILSFHLSLVTLCHLLFLAMSLCDLLAFCLLQSQKWTDDKDISSCQGCQKEFSVARRKVGGAGMGGCAYVCGFVCISVWV